MELSSQLKIYGLLNETFVNKKLNGNWFAMKHLYLVFSVADADGFEFWVSIKS